MCRRLPLLSCGSFFGLLATLVSVAACGSDGDRGPGASNDDDAAAVDAAPPASDSGVDTGTSRGPVVAYASGYGTDIDVFAVDPTTGVLAARSSITAGDPSPSFLALRPGGANLYAVGETSPGRVGAYAIAKDGGALTYLGGVSSTGNGPAHVSVDPSGKWVMVANYGDGAIAVYPIGGDGTLGSPSDTRNAGMNAHMIVADASDHFVFVPCLGSDYVAQYRFDAATGVLAPNDPPTFTTASGAGPRHIAFHPDGKHAYLVDETVSVIESLAFDPATGLLSRIETQSTRAAGASGKNTDAEVAVHPSGKWVYASNRGDDDIAVFAVDGATGKLTLVENAKTGGQTPRSFGLDPSGAFLYVANQDGGGELTSFAVSAADGRLSPIGSAIPQDRASFVGAFSLP